jgi:hypothetical protein
MAARANMALVFLSLHFLNLSIGLPLAACDLERGKEIYTEQCARCHGADGEGVPKLYPQPLEGDRAISDLSQYISQSMPEDDPERCVGDDAKEVASYVYESFYSEIARYRKKPPRIGLMHLTHRQYEESIADLLSPMVGFGTWKDQHGLQAEYRAKRKEKDQPRKSFERVDATIDFQFSEQGPDPEQFEAEEYNVEWSGGLQAQATGIYEFHLETSNGFRFYVNNLDEPLIDAWVRSGDNTQFSEQIRLLGGRVYPIRLEMQKAKQETGRMALSWKPPFKSKQVIPGRHLSPGRFPQVLLVETAFPPDDSSFGYERGVDVSREWDDATTQAALELSGKILKQVDGLAGINKEDDAPQRDEKLLATATRILERLLRRPLSHEDRERFLDKYWKTDQPVDIRLKRILLRGLKSPDFLFPDAMDDRPSVGIAARLARVLWDSLPDDSLWQAALADQLEDRDQVRRQAERMVQDPRTHNKLRYFLAHWMHLERANDVSKDASLFPGFDQELASDLRTSLEMFVDDVLKSDGADFRQLLQADYLYANGRMAEFYGLAPPTTQDFDRIPIDPRQRAGILTHPYLMAGFAYHKSSSPIHRGVFLARNVLGRTLRPPPIAIAPTAEDDDASLTTRERVLLQTKPDQCQTCHTLINPLGFSLENYDAVGRYRTQEKDRSIDATGSYRSTRGEEVRFTGARELANFLAAHRDTHESFVEHGFHQFVQQPIYAYGPSQLADLTDQFMANNFHIRKLLVDIACVAALPPPSRN